MQHIKGNHFKITQTNPKQNTLTESYQLGVYLVNPPMALNGFPLCLPSIWLVTSLVMDSNHHNLFRSDHTHEINSCLAWILPRTSIQRQHGVSSNYIIIICRSGGQVWEEVWKTVCCLLMGLVMSSEEHKSHPFTLQSHRHNPSCCTASCLSVSDSGDRVP